MPPDKGTTHIERTTNTEDFAICAGIMVKTDPWLTLGMDHAHCLQSFPGAFREVFVLKDAAGIIGFVVMQTQGTFKGYIQTLAIKETHRGLGFGTKLLQFCEQRILQYSPNVFICVSETNKGALALYIKLGFELIGELKDFVKTGFTELMLRKTVGQMLDYKGPASNS
jgi:ribosomal protein S18 acetylase RimI-like enzyme